MKKHIILSLLFCAALILSGCDVNKVQDTEHTPTVSSTINRDEILGEIKDLIKNANVDYSGVSGEEYRIRSVIEAPGIYDYNKNDRFNEQEFHENKYGINDFVRLDDWFIFNNFKSMDTVLHNKDFQTDFNKKYGIGPPESYSMPSYIIWDSFISDLLYMHQKYYFSIQGTELDKLIRAGWGVYYCSEHIGAEDIANLYARLDGLELKSKLSEYGNTVYYFTADNGCTLFKGMAIETHEPTTAYIWEQEGFIGVLAVSGEYNEDDLSYCKLGKVELK